VAADYYAAMHRVERQLALPEDKAKQPPSIGQLIALTDALHRGTLSQLKPRSCGHYARDWARWQKRR